MNKKSERGKNENIQVFVRCRPLNASEIIQHSHSVVETLAEHKQVIISERAFDRQNVRTFMFDRVFGPTCKQIDVYRMVAGPAIKEVLMGYNCTIFAYGQTGTGKTFTMEGEKSEVFYTWKNDPLSGLIPRALQQIYEDLEAQDLEFRIRVSYLELYNEELFDLLGPLEGSTKLRIFEDSTKKGSVVIQGLEEVSIRSKNDIYTILEKGSTKRHKATTLLNASSSRSHTIFTITAHIKESNTEGEELLKIGKLNLVDLAGSENINRSGAVDKRAREAGNINQSLLTLGRVITALYEKTPHVPYRESKLTRLLQDSLGGRTKTSIIATISPAHCNYEETLNTLEYASRAKNITNKPELNEKLTTKTLVKEYTEEIKRLKKDLEAVQTKNGFFVDEENYKLMQQDLSFKDSEIKKTIAKIEVLKEQIEKINALFCSTKEDLQKTTNELHLQKKKNEETTEQLQETSEELAKTNEELQKLSELKGEKQHLLYHHMKTESKLLSRAEELRNTVDGTVADAAALHNKIERIQAVEYLNEQRSQKFRTDFQRKLMDMEDSISVMSEQHLEFVNTMRHNIGSGIESFRKQMESLSHVMSTMVSSHNDYLGTLSSQLNNQGKAEQKWAGEVIRTAAQNKESASSNHRTFLSEQFIPQMNIIQMLVQSQTAILRETGKSFLAKMQQQEASVRTHLTEQKDMIDSLWKSIKLLSSEHRTGLEICQQHVTREMLLESEMYKEVDEQIHIIQRAMSKLKQSLERHNNQVNQEGPMIQKQLDELASLGHSNQLKIESEAKSVLAKTQEFSSHLIDDIKDTTGISKENFCKIQDSVDDLREKHETLKSEILEFGHQSEQMWEQNYRSVETAIRQHSETELQDLQDNQFCIQELRAATRSAAEQHESFLERQKLEFEAQIASQKSVLGNMEDSSAKWVQEFSSRIWKREEEVEAFLMEEWQKDQPTGLTPDMKQYVYSREIPQTSPHSQILERLRSVIHPPHELPGIPESPQPEYFKTEESEKEDEKYLSPIAKLDFEEDSFLSSSEDEASENKENGISPVSKKTVTSTSSVTPLRINNS